MHPRRMLLIAAASASAGGCATSVSRESREQLVAQVRAAEVGFALTMARRDLDAFGSHLADDAVFINGGKPLRGKPAVVAFWKRFFSEPTAPFSWKPEIVEVASNGSLGYTEGPVASPTGVVSHRFFTTWQRSGDRWLVIFDNGYSLCKS